jgi:hypothetical protein
MQALLSRHRCLGALVCLIATSGSVIGQHFELSLNARAATDSLILKAPDPAPGPTTLERAMRSIEKQIDEKRAADFVRSPVQAFWEASFWKSPLMKLIPIPMGPQRYVEDPYLLPGYLTISERQSNYQLRLSDERARDLFAP